MQSIQFKSYGHNVLQRFSGLAGDRRLPGLAMLAALLFLTHSMAALTWKFIPLPADIPMESLRAQAAATDSEQSASPVEVKQDKPLAGDIRNMHLFGKFEIKKEAPPAPVLSKEPPKPTRLNLKLKGIFASTIKDNARAIIADAKNSEDSYKVGDDLPGGAKLHQILTDKVILENRGKLETLLLPEDIAPGDRNAGGVVSRAPVAPAPSPSVSSGPIDTANAAPGALLRDIRDRLVSDPQSVMNLIRAQPFRKNGKLAGYRIRPGQDRQLLEKFGLRSGDVVTAINGVPMDNPLKALELMRDLKSANSLSVDIERRGVPQSLNFSIP